jgi:hypothetical protein
MTHCVALEEQAEYLATQWMSVGQLEKAGEWDCQLLGNVQLHAIRHSLSQGSVCRTGDRQDQPCDLRVPESVHLTKTSTILATHFVQEHNLDDGELENLIYSSDRTSGFWSRVGQC